MGWVETHSEHFAARHEERDDDDVVELLELLEGTRERLAAVFPAVPGDLDVVVHGTRAQLLAAQPLAGIMLRGSAPAARRYVTGWAGEETIHLLAPRLLRERASNVPGSRELAVLSPAALYAQVVAAACNPRLRLRPHRLARFRRWAWLWFGAGQYFGGQTPYARPAIARRLHEGPAPAFPPQTADALLLGGTVVDLLAREEGEAAAVAFVCDPPDADPGRALVRGFHGRSLGATEGVWRAHLSRVAAAPERDLHADRADRARGSARASRSGRARGRRDGSGGPRSSSGPAA